MVVPAHNYQEKPLTKEELLKRFGENSDVEFLSSDDEDEAAALQNNIQAQETNSPVEQEIENIEDEQPEIVNVSEQPQREESNDESVNDDNNLFGDITADDFPPIVLHPSMPMDQVERQFQHALDVIGNLKRDLIEIETAERNYKATLKKIELRRTEVEAKLQNLQKIKTEKEGLVGKMRESCKFYVGIMESHKK
ncbi:hypothetical protein V9T40_004701 [Parthenolecanium corni]|uniref:Uncharacterized protein n=1 Tax=Parthenolecanium corni TaxID=536013 RepID=A0AAN9T4X1_9HEMI